jgi:hypothetical protein
MITTMLRALPYDQMRVTRKLQSAAEYGGLLITLGLFLAAVGLFSLDWFHDLGREGISTVGAERVLNGEIPYRDFWTMYAPGQFYLVALLFKIFGTYLLVEVIAASIVCAAAACVCYRLMFNLVGRNLAALVPAVIFLAALYNTGYFKRLGSYSPAILFIFVALNLVLLYYKKGKLSHLIGAGVATGLVITFKHDVGGYTAIAIVAGLIVYQLARHGAEIKKNVQMLALPLIAYCAGAGLIVLPILIYFAVSAGPDLLKDLVVFPLTDFRFARGESYPGLFPFGLYNQAGLKMLDNFFIYFHFNVPFALFLLGLVAIGLALRSGKPEYVAAGVTFSVGYLLHYAAAHVQINTHIITMSVYAACLGVILYSLVDDEPFVQRVAYIKLLLPAAVFVWFLSLAAKPAYRSWEAWKSATTTVRLAKVSGVKVLPDEARALTELSAFVNTHVPQGGQLFVGLHRHDVVIIGDVIIYFILNRPNATRYQELHPAITDTASVQREIISALKAKNIDLVILKHIFGDEALERVKSSFLRNLPHVGATDLDDFIREHYVEVEKFGPYAVWQRKEIVEPSLEPYTRGSSGQDRLVRKLH